jgi:hypothetical protein
LGRRGEYLHFYSVFVAFHQKCKSLRSQFSQMLVAVFLATRAKKRAILIGNLQGFLIFRKKELVCKAPFGQGGGGVHGSPKRHKKGPIPAFLQCFLVLHKIKKRASQPALKRPSWEFFGAPSPKERHFTCIFTVFSHLEKEKTCIFTWFWGFGTPAESNQGHKEREKNTILPAFLQGFGVLGEKVKG